MHAQQFPGNVLVMSQLLLRLCCSAARAADGGQTISGGGCVCIWHHDLGDGNLQQSLGWHEPHPGRLCSRSCLTPPKPTRVSSSTASIWITQMCDSHASGCHVDRCSRRSATATSGRCSQTTSTRTSWCAAGTAAFPHAAARRCSMTVHVAMGAAVCSAAATSASAACTRPLAQATAVVAAAGNKSRHAVPPVHCAGARRRVHGGGPVAAADLRGGPQRRGRQAGGGPGCRQQRPATAGLIAIRVGAGAEGGPGELILRWCRTTAAPRPCRRPRHPRRRQRQRSAW